MSDRESKAALVAGLTAGAAFALVLEADLRLTGNNLAVVLAIGAAAHCVWGGAGVLYERLSPEEKELRSQG